MQTLSESTGQNEETEEESRPSMDLFKAIFASSSDEKSSEEESDGEEQTTPMTEPDSESLKPCDVPSAPSLHEQGKNQWLVQDGVKLCFGAMVVSLVLPFLMHSASGSSSLMRSVVCHYVHMGACAFLRNQD